MQCRPARQASVTGFQQIQERHRRGRLNDGERFSVVLRHFGNGGVSGKGWGRAGRAGDVTWLGAGATGDAATACARAGSRAPATKHANMSLPQKARRLRRIGTALTGLRNRHVITMTYGAAGHGVDHQSAVVSKNASVPIPKFAHPRGTLRCELRNQRDTSNFMILVRHLDLKFLNELAAIMIGTSNPPH
jgi:hypothetical protein